MGVNTDDREAMLALKGVGPTVVERMKPVGGFSLTEVAGIAPQAIIATVAQMWRSTRWAKDAVSAAMRLANGLPVTPHNSRSSSASRQCLLPCTRLIYVVGRFVYRGAYVRRPSTRGTGFMRSMLSTMVLPGWALVDIFLHWL